jgi:hypothetical protein
MEIKTKFKLLGILPRNQIIQFFVMRTHVAWVMLGDGKYMYVNIVSPNYYEQKQYLEFVAKAIKEKLVDTLRFTIDVKRHRLETSEHYIERMKVREKSYSFAGLEGEVSVEV